MHVTELKIGNYLYPIHLDGLAEVIGVDRNQVLIESVNGNGKSVVNVKDIHRLEPIRVDLDLLRNVQEFNEGGDAIRAQLNQFLELCYIIPEQQMRLQTVDSGFTLPMPRLHSLHELQNFWRSETGKELTIKAESL